MRRSVCFAPTVGCTVLGAPWPRDRRGGLGAPVRRDRQHPRHPRRACLASTAQRIQSRGHSPRTFFYGRTDAVRQPTPGGRGSPPLRCERVGIGVQPTLSVIRRRGVGDAAPYGRQRNHGISIMVSRCANAASLRPPLGSPERGAVAALCAVTEGLVPASVRRNNVASQPTPGGRGR